MNERMNHGHVDG